MLTLSPDLHGDMSEHIKRGNADIVFASGSAVLLKQRGEYGDWFLAANDIRSAKDIIAMLPDTLYSSVVAHGKLLIDEAQRRQSFKRSMLCYGFRYTKKEPPSSSAVFDIKKLTTEHFPVVREHYRTVDDDEYIQERIESGALFGAFEGGALLGFAGEHSEGSLGLLEVLPQYRRRGVASALASFLIAKQLSRGYVPYAHALCTNAASIAMQVKLGFRIRKSLSAGWFRKFTANITFENSLRVFP